MTTRNTELTAAKLRQTLRYEPETGKFYWIAAPAANRPAGSLAGTVLAKKGYVQIAINGVRYVAHRLAWLFITGEWPKQQIDHINGDRADNRFENLRDVSASVNQINSRSHPDRGLVSKGGKWGAFGLRENGRPMYLGTFQNKHSALLARKNYELRRYGELACRSGDRPKYQE